MKPKFNKLITLLMLLGTFTFVMEVEDKASDLVVKELSRWASLLQSSPEQKVANTINPYAQKVDLLETSLNTILPFTKKSTEL